MSFLSLFGIGVSKVEVVHTKTETPENKALAEGLQSLAEQQDRKVSAQYARWITTDVFKEIIAYHNYLDNLWGSRKFGRLMNHCASMLDMERCYDAFPIEDFEVHLEQVFWMCLFSVIPVKRLYFNPGSEDEIKTDLVRWMKMVGRLSEAQMINVINAVFAWDQIPVSEMEHDQGRFSMNAYHDAMRLEEIAFGVKIDIKTLRTHIGRNEVYYAYAVKLIANNRQPSWLLLLQELLSVEGFAVPDTSLLNQAVDGF